MGFCDLFYLQGFIVFFFLFEFAANFKLISWSISCSLNNSINHAHSFCKFTGEVRDDLASELHVLIKSIRFRLEILITELNEALCISGWVY